MIFDRADWEFLNADDDGARAVAAAEEEQVRKGLPPLSVKETNRIRRSVGITTAESRILRALPIEELITRLVWREYGPEGPDGIRQNGAKREARNPSFAALLLAAIFSRVTPINDIQAKLNFPLGHCYRFLGRAGIEFVALTAKFSALVASNLTARQKGAVMFPLFNRIVLRGRVIEMPPGGKWVESIHIFNDSRPRTLPPTEKPKFLKSLIAIKTNRKNQEGQHAE
jgi:hypothetical protein